jgi:hypothetical protein
MWPCYAAHQIGDGRWAIVAPNDDPAVCPAWLVVAIRTFDEKERARARMPPALSPSI